MGKSRVGCSVPSGGAQEQAAAAAAARWKRTFEGLRGARLFHLVSLSLQGRIALPGALACVWVLLVFGLFVFFFGFFLPGKFDFNPTQIPVVDRPCLALVRQCRKKKDFD